MERVDRVVDLFFLPPLAIARVGGSDTPLESFVWDTDPEAGGANRTVIRPAATLEVRPDGSVRPYLPSVIRFRDDGRLRPVAPFFELWAAVRSEDGRIADRPVTLDLLQSLRISTASVQYTITVANRKAQRRTGSAACGFIAHVSINGTDHERKPLCAVSPHNADQEPLVDPAHPIPLGHFQVIRPVEARAMGVDLSVLRMRFTPARGEVYGPPAAVVGPSSPLPPGGALPAQTLGGRLHEIVPARNRILNPNTPWSQYAMNAEHQQDPQPSDSYDGANVGDNRSWGVVDDTCDGIIQAELVVGSERFVALTRVVSSCPDFAPDRRPFFSFADDLADRDLPPVVVDDASIESTEAEIGDLFDRVFETSSLMNVDVTRDHGIYENEGTAPNLPGMPPIDGKTMTKDDPLADNVKIIQDEGRAGLAYTDVTHQVHGKLSDIESLLYFLGANGDRVRRMLRPPFGRFHQLDRQPKPEPHADFRDPRVTRDTQQDMRMPPYMRDSDETPLSLTWRQYHAVLALLARVTAPRRGRPRPGEAAKPETPLGRKVTRMARAVQDADGKR
jgi:hypothetical protein